MTSFKVAANSKVYLKGRYDNTAANSSYITFKGDVLHNVGGSVLSLLSEDFESNPPTMASGQFQSLFMNDAMLRGMDDVV